MTTNVNSSGTPTSPVYEFHSKIGNDGKYELVNGIHRLRWNDFQGIHNRQTGTPDLDFGMFYMTALNYGPVFEDLFSSNHFIAQSRLVSLINGADINLGVAVATGRQTVDLFVNSIRSLSNAAFHLRRGDLPGTLRSLGISSPSRRRFRATDLSSRWLEVQYGWLPLYSDCYNAAIAFFNLSQNRVIRFSASSHSSHEWNSSQSASWYGSGPAKGRVKIIAELRELPSVQRSLGLYDPLSIAWEVLPWSFVVDWFLPFGSYLANLNVIPFLEGRFMTIVNYSHKQDTVSLPGVFGYRGCTTKTSHYQTTRTVSSTLTTARPRFRSIPSAMSPRRIYNAVALFHQRFP